MQSSTIRAFFLDYFRSKDHLIMPSFSVIPQNDPTLLLIGAGMAPLKPYFTGEKKPPHLRVATCQKCVRTPDIERVGYTGRHATFFEMLGNFSFGDYFKEEAIAWAWDLVINGYRLPVDRLWVSIYEEDDEAFKIWNENIGVPAERIKRLGKKDNFWEIGLGPCGPCSEIYYDLGEAAGCGNPDCAVGCDCDRYLEIWNLVFTQFSREANGGLVELKQKNIDTGAGLERLAMALQGVHSLYDTDQVRPLYDHFVSQADPGRRDQQIQLRVVTEHSRGTTFMIADGVIPSNEGRGYVLRRLLRRAVRYGRLLGIEGDFMTEAASLVVDQMGSAYPNLKDRHDYIRQVVSLEEQKFQETLAQGMDILDSYLEKMQCAGEKILPGDLAFKLYDTFGFPLDLTAEILQEKGLEVDREAFGVNLKEQQERARAATRTAAGKDLNEHYQAAEALETVFTGYESLEQDAQLMLALADGKAVAELIQGDEAELFLDRSPFYAEAGGQVGDSGLIEAAGAVFKVINTVFTPFGQIAHQGQVVEGEFKAGSRVQARVDQVRRRGICRSHTSTHLLHRALRRTLGDHINQAGSLVAPDRLRFDFNHFTALSGQQLRTVEEEVNRMALDNVQVTATLTNLAAAQKAGATALFTDKYEEGSVRMVSAGDYTRELCGGTHVSATGEIGLFKIIAEEGIGSGLRRIEAVVGFGAYRQAVKNDQLLKSIAVAMNTDMPRLADKVTEHLAEHKLLQKANQELQQKIAASEVASLLSTIRDVDGAKVLSAAVTAAGLESLRLVMDEVRGCLSSIAVVLGAVSNGKVILVSSVTADLVERGIRADRLLKDVAKLVGGGGGGKADLAQAGGTDPAALPEALAAVDKLVREQLQGKA
ncbi:MAG: alanine--tRNA ligase [Firmicutes bacterium]|nr:alanine--tRNA ligase [Bacillota bacterium]